MALSATYVDSATFSCDITAIGQFDLGVSVRADCAADGMVYGIVTSLVLDTDRVIVGLELETGVLTNKLVAVLHSYDSPRSMSSHGKTNHAPDGRDPLDLSEYGVATQTDLETRAPASAGVTGGNALDHTDGDGAQINHSSLADLGDDDHPQYALADGSRAFTAPPSCPSAPTDAHHLTNKKFVEELVASGIGSSVPDGGTTGQVLGKLSDANQDAGWVARTVDHINYVLSLQNLYAFWPLNNIIQGSVIINDISGNSRNGTMASIDGSYMAYPSIVPTVEGIAYFSDRNSTMITAPIDASASFSLSLWTSTVNNAADWRSHMGIDGSSYSVSDAFLALMENQQGVNKTSVFITSSNGLYNATVSFRNDATTYAAGMRRHYVVTWDGSVLGLWVNGIKIGTSIYPGPAGSILPTSAMVIGGQYYNRERTNAIPSYYNCISWFTRNLTDEECLRLYRSGKGIWR